MSAENRALLGTFWSPCPLSHTNDLIESLKVVATGPTSRLLTSSPDERIVPY